MIPPNWLGSVLGAPAAGARAAEDRNRSTADEETKVRDARFADRLADVINETDRDTQVYSDAEGNGGGQGRSADEHPHADEKPDEDAPPPAGGLDVTA